MSVPKHNSETRKDSIEGQTLKEQFADTNLPGDRADEHHGENTKSFQEDKKIGQSNGAGRPPLMKK